MTSSISQHCEQIRVYQTCIAMNVSSWNVAYTFSFKSARSSSLYQNTNKNTNKYLLHQCLFLFRNLSLSLYLVFVCVWFFVFSVRWVAIISMGIVGVKSTAGREVKFVDPSMTTRGESAWLGYTLCDLIFCLEWQKENNTFGIPTKKCMQYCTLFFSMSIFLFSVQLECRPFLPLRCLVQKIDFTTQWRAKVGSSKRIRYPRSPISLHQTMGS